jgi:hypothetical protein
LLHGAAKSKTRQRPANRPRAAFCFVAAARWGAHELDGIGSMERPTGGGEHHELDGIGNATSTRAGRHPLVRRATVRI